MTLSDTAMPVADCTRCRRTVQAGSLTGVASVPTRDNGSYVVADLVIEAQVCGPCLGQIRSSWGG